MIRTTAFVLAVALLAVPALAEEPAADAPTATAQPSVSDQIAAFLAGSPAAQLPVDGAPGAETLRPAEPRKVHGVVDVAVGSHGYRSVYVRSDIPVGDSGMVSIAVGQSRGGYGGYGRGYGGYGRHFAADRAPLGAPEEVDAAAPPPQ